MVDILEIYFTEHVKKSKNVKEVADDFLVDQCAFAVEKGDKVRCQNLLERIIGMTNNARPEISDLLGHSYSQSGLYSKAYKCFFKARNVEHICLCLEKVMGAGYESERDLFVVRAILDMLIKSGLEKSGQILQYF